jgi:small subunit ribosomal protein S16
MALKIRLARGGAKKRPFYQIVVADARSPRDGRFVEKVGTYNPMLPQDNQDRIRLNTDRIKHWLSVGAQPTDRVALFLGKADIIAMPATPIRTLKSQPKAKAQERMKAEEEARKEAEEARKAAAEEAAKPAPQPEPTPEASAEPAETGETEAVPDMSGEAAIQSSSESASGDTESIPNIPGETPEAAPESGETKTIPETKE